MRSPKKKVLKMKVSKKLAEQLASEFFDYMDEYDEDWPSNAECFDDLMETDVARIFFETLEIPEEIVWAPFQDYLDEMEEDEYAD